MLCLTDNIWKIDALGSRLRTHVSSEQEVGGGASGKEVWDVICLQVRTAPPHTHCSVLVLHCMGRSCILHCGYHSYKEAAAAGVSL